VFTVFETHSVSYLVTSQVMDGFEATRRFRAWEEEQQQAREARGLPRKRRFLIVGMSANSDSMSKQEALDSGMDFFVAKPFAYKDLHPIIQNYKKEKEAEAAETA
jgi:CheY-like chemotaxis protein